MPIPTIERAFYFGTHLRWNLAWATPNEAGAFLATLYPWTLMLRARLGSKGILAAPRLIAMSAVEAGTIAALTFTYSRAALVAAIVAAAYCFYCDRDSAVLGGYRKYLRHIVFLSITVGVSGFYDRIRVSPGNPDGSITHRIEVWLGALRMMTLQPITGIGKDQSGAIVTNWFMPAGSRGVYTTPLNSFLQIGSEHGVGALFIAAMMAAFFLLNGPWSVAQQCRRHSTNNAVVTVARASLIAWLVCNLSTTLWQIPSLWILPLVAIAIIIYNTPIKQSPAVFQRAALIGAAITLASIAVGECLSATDAIKTTIASDGHAVLQRRNGSDSDWLLCLDRDVLGPTPGREVRQWYTEGTHFERWSIYPLGLMPVLTAHTSTAVVFGSRAEYLPHLLAAGSHLQHLYVINPRGVPPEQKPAAFAPTVTVVLGQVQEYDAWAAWASTPGASVRTCSDGARDLRYCWPAIVDGKRGPTASIGDVREDAVRRKNTSSRVPPSATITEYLHGITVTGGLGYAMPVGTNEVLRRLGLLMCLVHRLQTNDGGKPISEWYIPGLEVSLFPSGTDGLMLSAGSGITELISTRAIHSGKTVQGWSVHQIGPTRYEARSESGLVWIFEHGSPVLARAPTIGVLAVQARLGRIERLTSISPSSAPILTAGYAPTGMIQSLTVMGAPPVKFACNDTQVRGYWLGRTLAGQFSYHNGLLCEIDDRLGRRHIVEWESNPNWYNDSLILLPRAHLRRLDNCSYRFYIDRRGIHIAATDGTSIRSVCYNPWTSQVQLN